jgi:hypothetical protein
VRLRRAVVLLAAASFAAGVGVGLVAPLAVAAWSAPPGADRDADYVDRFAARYDLSEEQVRLLRAVHKLCDDEMMSIARSFDLHEWPREAHSRLVQAQRRKQQRVEYVLDDAQRERYRRDLGEGK